MYKKLISLILSSHYLVLLLLLLLLLLFHNRWEVSLVTSVGMPAPIWPLSQMRRMWRRRRRREVVWVLMTSRILVSTNKVFPLLILWNASECNNQCPDWSSPIYIPQRSALHYRICFVMSFVSLLLLLFIASINSESLVYHLSTTLHCLQKQQVF